MKTTFQILLILIVFISCSPEKTSKKINTFQDKTSPTENTEKSIENIETRPYDNDVSDLGIGIVIAPEKLEIYSDSLLKNKFLDFSMYSESPEKLQNLFSKFFKPDYGIMHFICLEETKVAYKVLVNYSDIKFLPKTKKYQFLDWKEYILQSYGVRRLKKGIDDILENLPLRIEPNNLSDTISLPKGLEMFCPIELKGDWVKVKYDCFYNKKDNENEGKPCHEYIDKCEEPLIGWLRWKKENKLCIAVFLMP
jgi:hypothetical protein